MLMIFVIYENRIVRILGFFPHALGGCPPHDAAMPSSASTSPSPRHAISCYRGTASRKKDRSTKAPALASELDYPATG